MEMTIPRITLTEAATVAGVTTSRLRQLCRAGRVRGAVKFGTVWTVITCKDGSITIMPGRRGPASTIKRKTQ